MKKILFLVFSFFVIHLAFGVNTNFDVVPTEGNDTLPPYDFYAKLNYQVKNALNFTHYFEIDDTISLLMHSTVPCTLYIFDGSNLDRLSESFSFNHFYYLPSDKNQSEADARYTQKLYLDIGEYTFLVVSNYGEGNCLMWIKDPYDSLNVSYGGWITEENKFSVSQCTGLTTDQPFNIFTCNTTPSTADPKLCVINNGRVVAYNDNYTGTSNYSWGKEARILKQYNTLPSSVIVYANYSSDTIRTNLFIGCKQSQYAKNFLRMKNNNDGIETAPRSPAYNCGAWALGKWNSSYFCNNVLTDQFFEKGKTAFESWLNCLGFTRDGATEANSVLDLWENDGEFTHMSVRCFSNRYSIGFGWESKLGKEERIMHPREALMGNDSNDTWGYGHISQYYIRNPYYAKKNIVDVDFSDEELSKINQISQSNSVIEKDEFLTAYDSIQNFIDNKGIENYMLLRKNDQYKYLVNLCKASPKLLGIAYKKLSEGENLPAQIIGDVTLDQNKDIIHTIKTSNIQSSLSRYSFTPVYSELSIAKLYVKELLKKMKSLDTDANVLYADDEFLSIKLNRNTIVVNFTLNSESTVSMNLQSSDGLYRTNLITKRLYPMGQQQISTIVNKKGLYIISFIVNGHLYTKKIKVI
jgi:hypothetical protein